MIKKLFLILLIAFSSVNIQAQTQRTRAYLDSVVVAQITTNNNREITGAQLRVILRDIIASFFNVLDDVDDLAGVRLVIEPADFIGLSYENGTFLASLTPEIDFAVFANDGAGTKVRFNEGYTYNSLLGKITIASGPGYYYIMIFNP